MLCQKALSAQSRTHKYVRLCVQSHLPCLTHKYHVLGIERIKITVYKL